MSGGGTVNIKKTLGIVTMQEKRRKDFGLWRLHGGNLAFVFYRKDAKWG